MAISQSQLVTQLQSDVPAYNGVPTAEQYVRCVVDALADLSRRAPLQKVTTIQIVAGTAVYAVPTDFVRIIKFAWQTLPGQRVIITGAGIVPLSATYRERVEVVGGQLTIYPTPTYSLARDLVYAAGYVPDTAGNYANLTEQLQGIAALKAKSLALSHQADAAARQSWRYATGDQSVNKEALYQAFQAQATENEKKYLAAIAAWVGVVGGLRPLDSATFNA